MINYLIYVEIIGDNTIIEENNVTAVKTKSILCLSYNYYYTISWELDQ